MTKFAAIDFPVEHQGVVRIERAVCYLREGAARLLRGPMQSWAHAGHCAANDDKARNATLHDARVMADLSRAMNGIAVEDLRRYR